MRRCCRCGQWKQEDQFSRNKTQSGGLNYWCKACYKEYYERNRERIRLYHKKYHREKRLTTKMEGKVVTISVRKRPYPAGDTCELCGRESRRLCYHHWDDTHPEWGMWLCNLCHIKAEFIEAGKDVAYRELKEVICRTWA